MEKGKEAIIQVMNGKNPKQIAKELGMSKSGVFSAMQKEGIMTKSQVVSLIEAGKNNDEIHAEGRWTIEAIENTREELMEKQEKRKADRRARDRKRKERMKAERQPGIEAKQKIRKQREQDFREALALGLPTEEIAIQFGFKDISTVRVKKSKERLLGRKEIRSLLEDHTDTEIAMMARIENVDIIARIRQEEQNRQERLTQKAEVQREVTQLEDEATFLKLAQNLTSVKIIAKQLELTEEQIREALYDYNIFTREEVIEWLDSKSDVQIAIMGNLDDHRVVERVRKEENARKLAEEMEGNVQEKPTDPEVQKKKDDEMFLRMAKNYEPVEKIGSIFQMNEYKVILRLRKLKLYSRPEVERMIEAGEASDIKIAGTVGNVNAVARIRRKIQKRELLIRSIPEDKRVRIREKIAVGIAVSSIAYDTRTNSSIIMAIKEKWKRDKDLQIPKERKKVNLKIDWLHLETDIRNVTAESSNTRKNSIEYAIEKILVKYEAFLTQRHYAYIAYAYMKIGKYMDGIEFTEVYLNLENSSIKGVKDRIDEILEQEKDKEKSGVVASSQNMKIEWPEMEDFGG